MNEAQRTEKLSKTEGCVGGVHGLLAFGGVVFAIVKSMLFSRNRKGENQWLMAFTNTKLVFGDGATFGVAS